MRNIFGLKTPAKELLARHMFSKLSMEIKAKERKVEFDYNTTILKGKVKDLEKENVNLKNENEDLKNKLILWAMTKGDY